MAVSRISTSRPTYDDCVELAGNLRAIEAEEVHLAEGIPAIDAIYGSVLGSIDAFAVRFDGELACLWGVAPAIPGNTYQPGVGYAWLLTTPVVERYPKTFWQLCLETLPELLERWGELRNWIYTGHEQALRWAARLGCRVADPAPYGVEGALFAAVSIRKGDLPWVQQSA